MPNKITRKRCFALLVLPCALLLAACGPERVRIATPPAEWTAPQPYPAIPAGEARCEGKGGPEPCLSDRETAALLASFADALDAANGRLLRLRDWFAAAGK